MSSEISVSPIVRAAAARLRESLEPFEPWAGEPSRHEEAYRGIAAALDECLVALTSTQLWGPENRLPSSELWNAVGEMLCRGWLQNQARIKPRGYAGDYEMLARIFENRYCDDPLGQHFDHYFQEQDAPQAVRNRMQMMADWIADGARQKSDSSQPLRVAIVGSAFGLDVAAALRSLGSEPRSALSISLLDMDPAALEFARQQLIPLLASADCLDTIPTNVFRLAERRRLAAPLANTDLLLCPGLFDYLDDSQAAAILAVFWEHLSPGGRLHVFQFAPHNPSRAYMEWLGNWYLIYRDADQLHRLATRAEIPLAATELGAEPLGVDLLLSVTRPL
jgi:extracellular factor (EF) 3-hydroxypalmitic acid methyl ester biosynthesis protein